MCLYEATSIYPIGMSASGLEAVRVGLARLTEESDSGIKARGEEALAELAQALAENPLVGGALARALGAGERAAVAQRQALGALNLASSDDVDRLEIRLRSLSSRLEAIEDSVDRLGDDVAALRADKTPSGSDRKPGS